MITYFRGGRSARRFAASCTLILAAALSACSGRSAPTVGPPPPTDFQVDEGDQLQITVWPDEMNLSGEYAVEANGVVYLPLVGPVEVAGLGLDEVRLLLRSRYAETLKEPVVSITPVFPVSVTGAVNRPGLYRVDPSQSLFDVISLAGGFTARAKEDEVRILRDSTLIELDASVDATSQADIGLRSGDRILVPATRWNFGVRDVLFVLQSVGLIITLTDRLNN